MASVTNLSAVLALDSTNWDRALNAAADRTEKFGRQTQMAMESAGGSTRRTGMIFQEAARGVEDFMVSFSTGGVAGGLRGASNNISQMATLLNPMAGAWAAIGVAISTVAVPALAKFFDLTGAIEKSIEAGKKRFDDFNASVQKQLDIRQKLREIAGIDTTEAANRRITEVDAALADARFSQQAIDRNALGPQARLDQLRGAIGPQLLQDIIGGGATGFAARRVGELAFRGVPGEPNTSFGQAVTEAQGLIAELADNEKARSTLAVQITELERERLQLGQQFSKLSEEQIQRDMQAISERAAEAEKARQMDTQRRTERLVDERLELDILRAQRNRDAGQLERRPSDEISRLQLQKLDRQIQQQERIIQALEQNGISGVGSE